MTARRPSRRVSRAGQPKPPPITDGLTVRLNRNVCAAALAAGCASLSAVPRMISPPMTRAGFERRLTGEYRWFLDDVDRHARALNVEAAALLTGSPETILPPEAATVYASIPEDGMPREFIAPDQEETVARLLRFRVLTDREGTLYRA